jgi:hypothetical protein
MQVHTFMFPEFVDETQVSVFSIFSIEDIKLVCIM